MKQFFIGLHQPSDASHLDHAFISVNRLRNRKKFSPNTWIMDSGAFSTILTHGGYPNPVSDYAREIKKWSTTGNLLAAVAQDYMCEAKMLRITGLTIEDHQALTIQRYDDLLCCDVGGVYIMPVLQGYSKLDYINHIDKYGDRLPLGSWVGIGSVCKRNGLVCQIEDILKTVIVYRPDLKLHGFGLKMTALMSPIVRAILYTSDSMAWSFAARYEGRDANDWREARSYYTMVNNIITYGVPYV